jgi:hypothetical protein
VVLAVAAVLVARVVVVVLEYQVKVIPVVGLRTVYQVGGQQVAVAERELSV